LVFSGEMRYCQWLERFVARLARGDSFMNLADHLRRQFSYNAWANREVLAAMRAGGADERSLQLMSHVLSAERLWLERMKQQPQSLPAWPKCDLAECETQAAAVARLWDEYLNTLHGDVSSAISYKNSKGEPWTGTVLDVLTHVITHSAYHRGQIASHMREAGHTPAYTDFIHAVRQGRVK
jgi:uncharacterized damage-inducible protein DinB